MIYFEHPNVVILILLAIICFMLKLFLPLYKENSKLSDECRYLEKELKNCKRERNNAYVRYKKNSEFQQSEHDREIGQVVTSEFNDIILSFVNAKPLVPNVSIEHLANLCRIPKANDRFFRALLQDFEILRLEIKRGNGKHDITMEIKSDKNTYTTTLTTCTCGDHYNYNGHKVCKHMYFLALTLGLISSEHYEAFQENALKTLPKEKIKSLKRK